MAVDYGRFEREVPSTYAMDSTDSRSQPETAETLTVPQERIVCVEHPCIVKNIDKGVKSLGGEGQVKNVGTLTMRQSLFFF